MEIQIEDQYELEMLQLQSQLANSTAYVEVTQPLFIDGKAERIEEKTKVRDEAAEALSNMLDIQGATDAAIHEHEQAIVSLVAKLEASTETKCKMADIVNRREATSPGRIVQQASVMLQRWPRIKQLCTDTVQLKGIFRVSEQRNMDDSAVLEEEKSNNDCVAATRELLEKRSVIHEYEDETADLIAELEDANEQGSNMLAQLQNVQTKMMGFEGPRTEKQISLSPISEPQPDFSRDVFTGFADTVSTDPVFTATISNDMVSTTMAQESGSLQNIQPCVELNSASAEMESPNQSTISDQGDVNSADGLSLSFEGFDGDQNIDNYSGSETPDVHMNTFFEQLDGDQINGNNPDGPASAVHFFEEGSNPGAAGDFLQYSKQSPKPLF